MLGVRRIHQVAVDLWLGDPRFFVCDGWLLDSTSEITYRKQDLGFLDCPVNFSTALTQEKLCDDLTLAFEKIRSPKSHVVLYAVCEKDNLQVQDSWLTLGKIIESKRLFQTVRRLTIIGKDRETYDAISQPFWDVFPNEES